MTIHNPTRLPDAYLQMSLFEDLANNCNQREYDTARDEFFLEQRAGRLPLNEAEVQNVVQRLDVIGFQLNGKVNCKKDCVYLFYYFRSVVHPLPCYVTDPPSIYSRCISIILDPPSFFSRCVSVIVGGGDRNALLDREISINCPDVNALFRINKRKLSLFSAACLNREVNPDNFDKDAENFKLNLMFAAGANINAPENLRAFWERNLFLNEELFGKALDSGLDINRVEPESELPISIMRITTQPREAGITELRQSIFRGLVLNEKQRESLKKTEAFLANWPTLLDKGSDWDICVAQKAQAYEENFVDFYNTLNAVELENPTLHPAFASADTVRLVWKYALNIIEVEAYYFYNLELIDSGKQNFASDVIGFVNIYKVADFASRFKESELESDFITFRAAFFKMLRQQNCCILSQRVIERILINIELIAQKIEEKKNIKLEMGQSTPDRIDYRLESLLCSNLLNFIAYPDSSVDPESLKTYGEATKAIENNNPTRLRKIVLESKLDVNFSFTVNAYSSEKTLLEHALMLRDQNIEEEVLKNRYDEIIEFLMQAGGQLPSISAGLPLFHAEQFLDPIFAMTSFDPSFFLKAFLLTRSSVWACPTDGSNATACKRAYTRAAFHGMKIDWSLIQREESAKMGMQKIQAIWLRAETLVNESYEGFLIAFKNEFTMLNQTLSDGYYALFNPVNGMGILITEYCVDKFFSRHLYRADFDSKVKAFIEEVE